MVHFPIIVFFKVGITSMHIGAGKRAKDIDKTMPGIPIPIFILPIPGAWHFEQAFHRMCRKFRVNFYKGDGRSEWFFLAPVFLVIPTMCAIWCVYLYGIDRMLGTRILPVLADSFFEALI